MSLFLSYDVHKPHEKYPKKTVFLSRAIACMKQTDYLKVETIQILYIVIDVLLICELQADVAVNIECFKYD